MDLIANGVYNSQHKIIPKWIIIWLLLSMTIVLWDVLFVLLRPASFAEGMLGMVWIPYAKYIQIDTSYADLNNAFVKTQAMMSLGEIVIGIVGIYFYFVKQFKLACLLIYSTQLLTAIKTILIFLLEIVGGFPYTSHNSYFDLILYYFLPNSIWIILPLIVVITLGRSLYSR